MQTNFTLTKVPARYGRDLGDPASRGSLARAVSQSIAASAIRRTELQQKNNQASRAAAKKRVRKQYEEGRMKFTVETQPRDNAGKFRRVLARLKLDLGDQASAQLAKQLEEAEAAGAIGNYAKAREAGAEVIKLVDSVEAGSLDKGALNNIRKGAENLGKLLAYLPLPQGDANAKIRFSDLPSPTASLIQDLVNRVKEKLSNEDAAKYVAVLQSFMAGGQMMSADEMSAELSKVLRVLA